MKKNILLLFIMTLLFTTIGCGKQVTMKELRELENQVQNKLDEYYDIYHNYNGLSAYGIDEKEMVLVITLVNNNKEEQEWFKENISDSKYIKFKKGGPYTTSFRNVSLYINENTITKTGATFILKNNTNDEYWYGQEYYIERKEENVWVKIATDYPLTWNAIAYTLKANEEKEINIDWSISYGELSDGKYRLVKYTFREKDRPIDESKKLYLYAEFTIATHSNIVAGTGNTIQVKKTKLQNTNKFNEYLKKDGITIYFASNIEEVYLNLFYRDISNMTLKYYIENINEPLKDAIKDITHYLNREGIYKDGGSAVYRSKEYDITLVKCNNMSGNKDVYIGDYNMNTDGITMCSR